MAIISFRRLLSAVTALFALVSACDSRRRFLGATLCALAVDSLPVALTLALGFFTGELAKCRSVALRSALAGSTSDTTVFSSMACSGPVSLIVAPAFAADAPRVERRRERRRVRPTTRRRFVLVAMLVALLIPVGSVASVVGDSLAIAGRNYLGTPMLGVFSRSEKVWKFEKQGESAWATIQKN